LFKLQTAFGKRVKSIPKEKPVGSEKIKMPSDTFVRRGSMLLSCRDTSHCLSVNKLLEVKMPRFPYNFIHLPSVSRVK